MEKCLLRTCGRQRSPFHGLVVLLPRPRLRTPSDDRGSLISKFSINFSDQDCQSSYTFQVELEKIQRGKSEAAISQKEPAPILVCTVVY